MSARIGLVDALRSGVAMLSKVGRGVVLPGMFMLSLALAAGAPGGANRTEVQGKSTCGDYGTAIEFEATPKEAAKRAAAEEKLVMVLHVSGHFEDPGLT